MSTTGRTLIWDKEVDVVVVGFGAAGGVSAITAHDAGAKVLLIEKMPTPRRDFHAIRRWCRVCAQRRRRISISQAYLQRHYGGRHLAQNG